MTTLPLFWHLSSSSTNERIGASVKLVSALQQFQAQFAELKVREASDPEDEVSEDANEIDLLESSNAQDVTYSVRRLVRGLASPREHSRLGFAVALTELLSRLDTVTCSQIYDLIMQSTQSHGSSSGQEERDMLFARLFGFTSIVQSGLLLRTAPLTRSTSNLTPATSLDGFKSVLDGLLILSEKKTWLRESVGWTIGLIIDALDVSKIEWKSDAVQYVTERIVVGSWSPEKITHVLRLRQLNPKYDWNDALAPVFKNGDLLAAVNLKTLARILKESSLEGEDTASTSGGGVSWKPQLHFVWDLMLDQLVDAQPSKNATQASLPDFFRAVVEESLFTNASSPQRKFWGFRIFQKALPLATESQIPQLFTQNFMRTWINHLSKNDRHLHKIALETATTIQDMVQKNPRLGLAFVLQLTGVHGSQQFDKLTRTKTLESLLASMDASGIESYVAYLLEQFNAGSKTQSTEAAGLESVRTWIIEQMATLIRNGAIPKNDIWIETVLNWLTLQGFFDVKKKSSSSPWHALRVQPNPPLSAHQHALCRSRLLSCLADIAAFASNTKFSKASEYTTDGSVWLYKVLKTLGEMQADQKHLSWVLDGQGTKDETCAKAIKLIKKLDEKSTDNTINGVKLLLLAITLYSISEQKKDDSGEEDEEADLELLEASITGAQGILSGTKQGEMGDVEPIDAIVEVVVASLELSSAYMRGMATASFALLSKAVTKSTVELLLSHLSNQEEAEDVEMSVSDEEDAAEEGGSDVEPDLEADSSEDDQDDDSEAGSSSEADDDDDDSASDIDQAFRDQLAAALQVEAPNLEILDTSESGSDSEESMDDEQMMAIDEQLAEVFKSRISDRQGKKFLDIRRQEMHFRIRVLDLIDVFIKNQPTSPMVPNFIIPLLDLVTSGGNEEQHLSDKAHSVLKSRITKSKDAPEGIVVAEVTPILSEIHRRARHLRSPIMDTLSFCSLYLTRTLSRAGAESDVTRIYGDTLKDFVTRKNSSITHSFLQSFLRRYSNIAWPLRSSLLDLLGQGINTFRETQVIEFLQTLVTRSMNSDLHEVQQFLGQLQDKLVDSLLKYASSEPIPATAKDTLKLASTAIRQSNQLPTETRLVWDIERWTGVSNAFESSSQASPALRTLSKQILAILSKQRGETPADVEGPKKRKGATSEIDGDVHKRKKSKVAKGDKVKKGDQ